MRKKFKNLFIAHKGNNRTPHILSQKSFWAALSLLALIELTVLSVPLLGPRLGTNISAVLPSVLVVLTNDARAESGLSSLEVNDVLASAAQAKADDMAEKGYFAHQSPDGTQPWQWMERAGYEYEYAGENLAVNFSDSEEVVSAWVASPTHKLNLMGPRYTQVGIAVAKGVYKGHDAVFVVQMLASPDKKQRGVPFVSKPRTSSTISNSGAVSQSAEHDVRPVVLGAEAEKVSLPIEEMIVSSPKTYSTYAYLVLAGFFLVVLLLSFTSLSKYRLRRVAVIRVLLILLAVLVLIIFNSKVVFGPLELPVDNENAASVISAI